MTEDRHGHHHDHATHLGSRHEEAHEHHHDDDHEHRGGPVRFLVGLVRPHSHDHADSLDNALMVSKAGTRALGISLSGLLVTAVIQLIVFAVSGSVGLLSDTMHNFADAFTALPIGIAFAVARRAPTRRYTYGFGRGEDLAGLVVVLVIAASAAVTAWEAIDRLIHPHHVTNLGWVAAAGFVGFVGNELAARYRMRVGNQIGSAALVADGHHARADGFTSLAVVVGAGGVAEGWRLADPIVGLVITVAILAVLRGAARDVYRRLMDAVDPALIDQVEHETAKVSGVAQVDTVRVRWVGHELRAELNVTVDRDLRVYEAHDVAEEVRHALLHHVPRLTDATIHTDPLAAGEDPHEMTAHHYNQTAPGS
ncbi:MAG: cation diffusion facilitator family transporter [Actinomycetota bacterium]|nr:cation diffusion facilitator family transporter [Actinomycetota bacterium]